MEVAEIIGNTDCLAMVAAGEGCDTVQGFLFAGRAAGGAAFVG